MQKDEFLTERTKKGSTHTSRFGQQNRLENVICFLRVGDGGGGKVGLGRDSKEEPRFTLVYATLRPSHTMHGRVSPLSVQFD